MFGSGFPELLLLYTFCLVDFDHSSCIDRMIYLVLYIFEVCFGYLVSFVYIRIYYVRIVGNNYIIF